MIAGNVRAVAAPAQQNYVELEKAILDGKDIRMTLDLAKCLVHGSDKPGPPIRGSLRFDGFMIQADQSIAFSTMHFTIRSDNTPVREFLSFKVAPSGKVDARSRFLNAASYAVFQEAAFDCSIGEGTVFHW